jgi:transcriptional regulator with XRE-family HTH domain
MRNRIRYIRKEIGLSQEEFANKLNLKRNSITLIETGNRNASDRTIMDICETFNVNPQWLRTGDGDVFQTKTKINEKLKELTSLFDELTPELQEYIVLQTRNLLSTQEKLLKNT